MFLPKNAAPKIIVSREPHCFHWTCGPLIFLIWCDHDFLLLWLGDCRKTNLKPLIHFKCRTFKCWRNYVDHYDSENSNPVHLLTSYGNTVDHAESALAAVPGSSAWICHLPFDIFGDPRVCPSTMYKSWNVNSQVVQMSRRLINKYTQVLQCMEEAVIVPRTSKWCMNLSVSNTSKKRKKGISVKEWSSKTDDQSFPGISLYVAILCKCYPIDSAQFLDMSGN